jgi:glucosamine--fructose-6-phosphate aminotransferase (isomerizing)
MCGITIYLGLKNAFPYLFNGLTLLQNRGYDSCGVVTINQKKNFVLSKFASTDDRMGLDRLKEDEKLHEGNYIGLSHNRWATHGAKNDTNSHPHLDCKDRIAVVHNGIIENYKELKLMLVSKGYTFRSDTDTEVISNLISYNLDQNGDIHKAIVQSLKMMHGTWGLGVLYSEEPDKVFVSRNGSPLLIGYEESFVIVASEPSAFVQYANKYISLDDGDIIELGINKYSKINILETVLKKTDHTFKTSDSKTVLMKRINTSPYPYPHWTIKEIMEQPMSIQRALNMGGRLVGKDNVRLGGLDEHKESLLKIKNLIILACGTSRFAGVLGAKYLRKLHCFNTVSVVDASEFVFDDLPDEDYGILVLSQSGETKDVHRAMELAKQKDIFIFSIVNVVGSLIARDANCGTYLNAGREVGVASTKSFTSQVVVMTLISIWFSFHRGKSQNTRIEVVKSLRNLSIDVEETLKCFDQCKKIAKIITAQNNCFILGRGMACPIAYEGALKMKEISYINAQGYPAGSLKHGPFALIEKGTPIFLISLDDDSRIHSAAQEVKARGAYNILITDQDDYDKDIYDEVIEIPKNKMMGSILSVVPLQIIAYELSLHRGHNPDVPRNLAKCVTTD